MEELMPMVDALAVCTEEGRVLESDNNGETLSSRYQPLVSEWSNPLSSNMQDSCRKIRGGTLGTETSKYREEKKS